MSRYEANTVLKLYPYIPVDDLILLIIDYTYPDYKKVAEDCISDIYNHDEYCEGYIDTDRIPDNCVNCLKSIEQSLGLICNSKWCIYTPICYECSFFICEKHKEGHVCNDCYNKLENKSCNNRECRYKNN